MKLLLLVSLVQLSFLHAQQDSIRWWNPVGHDFHTIEGQAWPDEVIAPYDRLPRRTEKNSSKSCLESFKKFFRTEN